MAFKMKNPSMAKMVKAAGDNRAAMKMKMEEKAAAAKMKKEAAMKMKKESSMKMDKESMAKLKEKASAMKMKKSPMEKELKGDQKNLNEGLKKAIEAAPSKMKKSAMKKKDNRSLFQKAKDEGKQIVAGFKELDPDEYNISNNIRDFKYGYKKQEKKDRARAAGNKKSPSKMSNESANKMKKGEPMKMKKDSAMKLDKKEIDRKIEREGRERGRGRGLKKTPKMNMVKGPDGKMVPDFAVDGKGAGDMKSPAKKKNPNVQGSKAKALNRKLDKADKKDRKASKKYNAAFDTGGHNTGGKGFDRKLKAADRKGRKADKKRAKAQKKIAKILGYHKFLSKDEKKAMR